MRNKIQHKNYFLFNCVEYIYAYYNFAYKQIYKYLRKQIRLKHNMRNQIQHKNIFYSIVLNIFTHIITLPISKFKSIKENVLG